MDLLLAGAHDHGMSIYHDASRRWQDRFDTRRLADRIEDRIVHDSIDDDDRAFIEARDMFFLATADEDGFPTCSYKGGDPGFVRVLDERTIAFPVYDGNGMFLSLGNLTLNPRVGLLFIDFEGQKRLRLDGLASVEDGRPAARRIRARAGDRARRGPSRLSELPSLHPQAAARRALALHAACGLRAPRARLEAARLGARRARRRRPCERVAPSSRA